MSLFDTPHMDLGLLIFIMIVCLKYALKDKDYKGFKWIVIGGLSLLLQNTFFFIDWSAFSGFVSLFRDISAIVTFIIMTIGSLLLIIEFLKE